MAVQTNILPTATSAPGTAFSGPVVSGDLPVGNTAPNQGLSICMQQVTLNQNSTTAVSATLWLPKHSVINDIIVDSPVAWDSATSANLTVGTAAAGTQYAGGAVAAPEAVSVKTGGRQRFALTATQSGVVQDTGSNAAVVATVTPVGATTAGQTVVTIFYTQTANYQNP
jgi:hypothetical protein